MNWVVVEGLCKNGLICWIVLRWCFDFKFYIVWSVFYVLKPINNLWEQIWMLRDQNLSFWVKNGEWPVRTGGNSLEARLWQVLSGRNSLMAKHSLTASYSVTDFPVSRSCILFTHFCFELAFGVNMKVLDNCVRFPMVLVWLENDF